MMQMPEVTDAHRRLEMLVGIWKGEETLNPSPWDPKGGTATGIVKNRLALDGFAVIQDYEQIRDGKTTFKGHGVFQWDPKTSQYALYWWDSMGFPCNDFRGDLKDKVLTVENRGEMGQNRVVMDCSQPGVYRFVMDVSPDGKTWTTFMEGKYRKEG